MGSMTGQVAAAALSAALVVVIGCGEGGGPPRAAQGVLNLRAWDLAADGSVPLSGDWEMYWKQLLTSSELRALDEPPPTRVVRLPSLWT